MNRCKLGKLAQYCEGSMSRASNGLTHSGTWLSGTNSGTNQHVPVPVHKPVLTRSSTLWLCFFTVL